LRNNIGLNITVIVFASPHKVTTALDSLGNEIIDKTVFIIKIFFFKLGAEVLIVFFLEDIHEHTVILLQNSVFGREFEGHATSERE